MTLRPELTSASVLEAVRALQAKVVADPDICVAVLDGPADLTHPCFRGSNLRRVDTLVQDAAGTGRMSAHGTHVASIVFGHELCGALGVAPGCRGLLLPVFRDAAGHLSQLDLARAIERAVLEGANIINVSGGEKAHRGEPDPLLARALDLCEQSNVLVVAAAGNDGCDCVHVPAAVPSVLAVGALGDDGAPVASSNYGEQYRANGVLAPGERIPGAVPGGGIAPFTGNSFATPIVSAVAALLMSAQKHDTGSIDARVIRDAILAGAIPCQPADAPECARFLAGTLDPLGAYAITRGGKSDVAEIDAGTPSDPAPVAYAGVSQGAGVAASAAPGPPEPGAVMPATDDTGGEPGPGASAPAPAPPATAPSAPGVGASCGCGGAADSCTCGATPSADGPPPGAEGPPVPVAAPVPAPVPVPVAVAPLSLVYALGNIGTDFGTEARRDTFRALMPQPTDDKSPPTVTMQPNPYDPLQLHNYLDKNPWESTKLIWTLNLELTPVYALEAEPEYADAVYLMFREVLKNQILPAGDEKYVSRVSIPGVLTNRTVQLFSGQVVPVVEVQRRGLFAWSEAVLVKDVIAAVKEAAPSAIANADDEARIERLTRQLLDKVYYQMRNLGQAPSDRAINYMATNAFSFAAGITDGLMSGSKVDAPKRDLYSLDSIAAVKSPYCRVDSDCWDVQVSFFDPSEENRASVVFQTTVDVSDELPVQLAPTRQFVFRV